MEVDCSGSQPLFVLKGGVALTDWQEILGKLMVSR